jgi:putative ABC transport system ATP-binding protein
MGYVLQQGGLCAFLSVFENIALPLRLNGMAIDRAEIEERLEAFGLAGFAAKKVRTLSGGERQRVAILRSMIHRPAVVFADEPTAALDFDNALIAMRQLKALAQAQGTAVLVVTHDLDLVRGFANQVVIIEPEDRPGPDGGRRVHVARHLYGVGAKDAA